MCLCDRLGNMALSFRSFEMKELVQRSCGILIRFIHIKTDWCRWDMAPFSVYQRADLSRHLLSCALSVNQRELERVISKNMKAVLRTLIHNTEQLYESPYFLMLG